MTAEVVVTSFGHGHAPAPQVDLLVDARRTFRNPHHDPAMRELTGLDDVVRRHVLATPGVPEVIVHVAAAARALAAATGRTANVGCGCTGGRHRAPVLAEGVAAELRAHGVAVTVIHRDVNKPVIQR
ncbi:RNase adapter RapZ [Nonomuraea sp. NPDC049158]|uniref:RapZ C-terminal domain-containing protein n=1 Tax=Nonomuraea sp. NPDC049158 TaxID=3155649 RepID=UPI0033EA9BD1